MYARRIPSSKDENYTWCCGEIALRSAKVAIFGTSAGDYSQKQRDKSRQFMNFRAYTLTDAGHSYSSAGLQHVLPSILRSYPALVLTS